MRHYQSDLRKRYSVLIIFFVVIIYLIYIAQVKIPKKEQNIEASEVKFKSFQALDSLYQGEMNEEFQNLPPEDKKKVGISIPDFMRSMPH